MRGSRIGRARVVLLGTLLVAAIVMSTGAAAAHAQSQPGNSASVTPDPGGQTQGSTFYIPASADGRWGVTVKWNAGCPNTSPSDAPGDYWSVDVQIDGGVGGPASGDVPYGPGPPFSAPPASNQAQFGLAMKLDAAGKPSPREETFTWTATLECGGDQTIGSGSFKFVSGVPCDPHAYSKAQREFDTADSLLDAGAKQLRQANQALVQFVHDYVRDTLEIIPEKFDAVQVLQEISTHVAEVGEVGGVVVGLSITAEQLELLRENYARLANGAQADFNEAKLLTARGNADLAQALASKGCLDPIEGQLNKIRKDQKRDEDARNLIDTWQNNGYVYVSPISHEIVDEATALKQAKAALTGHSGSRATSRSAAASVKANAGQLRAAITDIDAALGDNKTAHRDLDRLTSATNTLINRLRALPAS